MHMVTLSTGAIALLIFYSDLLYCRLAFFRFKTQLSEFYSHRSWNPPTTLNLLFALLKNFSKVKRVERSGIYLQTGE